MKHPILHGVQALRLAAAVAGTALVLAPVSAQQAPAAVVASSSEPGKAAAIGVVEMRARVVALDRNTRTVTLRGARGDIVDVVAGDEVVNLDRISIGDDVVVRFVRALSLELRKSGAPAGAPIVTEGSRRAAPGERPGGVEGREIRAVAEVTAVDPKAGTITLKGPRGNSVPLAVQNPEQFKVVMKGDKVDVTYIEAVAIGVEPATRR